MSDDYPKDFTNYPKSLTERKSDKEHNAAVWTPRDVLIDTLRALDSGEIEADALVVVHNKDNGGGTTLTKWAASSPNVITTLGMLEYAKQRIFSAAFDE